MLQWQCICQFIAIEAVSMVFVGSTNIVVRREKTVQHVPLQFRKPSNESERNGKPEISERRKHLY